MVYAQCMISPQEASLSSVVLQVNHVGPTDQIPILVAVGNGNVELLKLLHKSNADINVQVSPVVTASQWCIVRPSGLGPVVHAVRPTSLSPVVTASQWCILSGPPVWVQ